MSSDPIKYYRIQLDGVENLWNNIITDMVYKINISPPYGICFNIRSSTINSLYYYDKYIFYLIKNW